MKKIFLCVFLACLVGCSASTRPPKPVSLARDDHRTVDPNILNDGGKVVIAPFSAGVHAFASEKLDKAALIIMRGIEDGLTGDGAARFQVLHEEGPVQHPDLMIIGRIERLETRDGWKRYLGGKRKRFVEIRGKVIDDNNDIVAIFHRTFERPFSEDSEIDFLLQAGREIGAFLTSEK